MKYVVTETQKHERWLAYSYTKMLAVAQTSFCV